MKIALDAMGGDSAPASTVAGAWEALKKYPDIELVLVGDQAQLPSIGAGGLFEAAQEVARWRVVLGALLDDPDAALTMLRTRGRPSQAPRPSYSSLPAMRSLDSEPPRSSVFDEEATTIRVAALDVDRLLERFDALGDQ